MAERRSLSLAEIYIQQCSSNQCKPDGSCVRVLEGKYSNVTGLDFSGSYWSIPSFAALCDTLNGCNDLSSINFEANFLKAESLQCLLALLDKLPNLASLNISRNTSIGYNGALGILQYVKRNAKLVDINLEDTGISKATRDEIDEEVRQHRKRIERDALDRAAKLLQEEIGHQSRYGNRMGAPERKRSDDTKERLEGDRKVLKLIDSNMDERPEGTGYDAKVKLENMKLKQPIIEHEERTIADLHKLVTKCSLKKDNFSTRNTTTIDLLTKFDKGTKWAYSSSYNTPQLITEASLAVSLDTVRLHQETYDPSLYAAEESIKKLLQEVLEYSTGRRRANQIADELKQICVVQCVGAEDFPHIVSKLHELLHNDSATIDQVKQLLTQTDMKIPLLTGKAEQSESNRDIAIKKEDLENAELYHDSAIKLYEELLDICLDRVGIVEHNGPLFQAMKEVGTLVEDAKAMLREITTAARDKVQKAAGDLLKLVEHKSQYLKRCDDAQVKHDQDQRRHREVLIDNALKQAGIWDQVTVLMDQMRGLGEERMSVIDSWIHGVESLERMKIEYEQVYRIIDKHTMTLQNLQKQCESTLVAVRQFEDFIVEASVLVKRTNDACVLDTDQLLFDQKKVHHQVFRKYYLSLGDLLYRKEKRAQEIERQIRHCENMISVSVEMLDPALPKYREQKRELESLKRDTARKCQILRENGTKAANDYKKTYDYLIAQGEKFPSPIIEMQEAYSERKTTAIELVKKQYEREKFEVEADSAGVEVIAEKTKQAKLSGSLAMIPPLHNNPPVKFKKLE